MEDHPDASLKSWPPPQSGGQSPKELNERIMPVKDWSVYPKNWKTEIRPRILTRSGNKCEQCGLENGAIGWRDREGTFTYAEDYLEVKRRGFGFYITTGRLKIVLTISHTDHDTTNNEDDNLKALCQRCHLRHDAGHHAKNAKATRDARKGQPVLGAEL